MEVILHCYQYGRNKSPELEQLCKEIFYYERRSGFHYYLNALPYIVVTRSSSELLRNLTSDPYPVLFEGIHTSYFIRNTGLQNKLLILRTHNIEHKYYLGLAIAESSLVNKLFFLTESGKLKRYEYNLPGHINIAAISASDADYFGSRGYKIFHLPPFHPNAEINSLPGKGEYILVHGDLSVAANISSVEYLINNVVGNIPFRVIIAGKNPARRLLKIVKQNDHITLHANPNDSEMFQLVQQAQINLIHSFQFTGIKLKLLAALFNGRHCLTNPESVQNSGLENLCHIEQNPRRMRDRINELMEVPFTEEEIQTRDMALKRDYSNKANAQKIIDMI